MANPFSQLPAWYQEHGRTFPWRDTTDPWSILLAEVLLRQTRASDVVPVYDSLLARWPSPSLMACSAPADVRRVIAPLGLPTRGDHLVATSGQLCNNYGGCVPSSLADLLTLPGIGAYAARAIRCLAFGGEDALVDGNVRRILTRVLQLPHLSVRKLQELADLLVPSGAARQHNLGLLDLGALICRPGRPRCECCPIVDCTSEGNV